MGIKSEQEYEELYDYVKTNIYHYDKNQALPFYVVLRLKGLADGTFLGNGIETKANYSYKCILNTFISCQPEIEFALQTKNFKGEQHKTNYIIKVVQAHLNDEYLKMKASEKQELSKDDITGFCDVSNRFKSSPKKKENKKLNEMW